MLKLIRKLEKKGWRIEVNTIEETVMIRWGCQPIEILRGGKVICYGGGRNAAAR